MRCWLDVSLAAASQRGSPTKPFGVGEAGSVTILRRSSAFGGCAPLGASGLYDQSRCRIGGLQRA